jgi:hypothetical protein
VAVSAGHRGPDRHVIFTARQPVDRLPPQELWSNPHNLPTSSRRTQPAVIDVRQSSTHSLMYHRHAAWPHYDFFGAVFLHLRATQQRPPPHSSKRGRGCRRRLAPRPIHRIPPPHAPGYSWPTPIRPWRTSSLGPKTRSPDFLHSWLGSRWPSDALCGLQALWGRSLPSQRLMAPLHRRRRWASKGWHPRGSGTTGSATSPPTAIRRPCVSIPSRTHVGRGDGGTAGSSDGCYSAGGYGARKLGPFRIRAQLRRSGYSDQLGIELFGLLLVCAKRVFAGTRRSRAPSSLMSIEPPMVQRGYPETGGGGVMRVLFSSRPRGLRRSPGRSVGTLVRERVLNATRTVGHPTGFMRNDPPKSRRASPTTYWSVVESHARYLTASR